MILDYQCLVTNYLNVNKVLQNLTSNKGVCHVVSVCKNSCVFKLIFLKKGYKT
jgi:hypothetical protein